MPENEKNFKTLMLKIGIAMLIFFVLFYALVFVYFVIDEIIVHTFEDPAATVISELIYAAVYASAFAIPAVILAKITKKDGTPLIKKAELPRQTILYIVAGIAIILAFAYINNILVSAIGYSDFADEELWKTDCDELYEVVLQLLTVAIIPGIFEELLFRGVVLAKLRPYGKTPAIIISALLFALMHQNSGQFLYAMVAGIVLGWVAVETGSLLCCMMIHFLNNALSVIEQAAYVHLADETYSVIFYSVELIIFVLGIAAFAVLVRSYYRSRLNKNDFRGGMFKKELVLSEEDISCRIEPKKIVKLFFSPTIIAFVIISFSAAWELIVESILY